MYKEPYNNPDSIVFTSPTPDLESLGVQKDSRILDLGCGYGRILHALHLRGYTNLTGVEISKKLLVRAKVNNHRVSFIQSNLLSFRSPILFDVILLCATIEYVPNEALPALARQCYSLLSEGGIIYIYAFTFDVSLWRRYLIELCKFNKLGILRINGVSLTHRSSEQIARNFSPYFSMSTSEKILMKTWSGKISRGIRVILVKQQLSEAHIQVKQE